MATRAKMFNPNDSEEAAKLFMGKMSIGSDGKMHAAADYIGPGAIEINKYESEILDVVRRESPTLARMSRLNRWVKAKGHPHRYFETLGIATASATDPRNIAPTPSGPNRVERSAFIKAGTAQSNFSHFDVEVTSQQGDFSEVEAQDMTDITSAIVLLEASMFWTGADQSLSEPSSMQWVGALTQLITANGAPGGGNVVYVNQFSGALIVPALKTEVASLISNPLFDAKPSAIYTTPMLADLIDQESYLHVYKMNEIEFVAGSKVSGIQTQAGVLPIATDPFLPSFTSGQLVSMGLNACPSGSTKAYVAAILSESMIELPYVNPKGDEKPRLFQLGLVAGLQGQFVGIAYNALILKATSYAHALVVVYVA